MFKYALLASAMIFAVPAFAQDTQSMPSSPQPAQSVPTTTDQALPAQPASATPQSAVPADSATAPAADSAVAAQPATGTQVAQVVSQEFSNYDKDGDGVLNAKEFDAWMIALKSASAPSTKATSPATKAWLNQAFAQADTDKNKKVSKSELTGFLSQQG
jgi:EF hand